jgi:TRAP-type C4-dicarboxylate transport system substrate-binding protein
MNRRLPVAMLLIAIVAAGCGGSGASRNKAGAAAAQRTTVLRLESTDGGSPEALVLAQRIKARSGGTLTVEVRQSYPASLPANEARLARALRAGKADFGFLPARAWPAVGVPALAALQAPFLLGDYDVARRALAGPAGATLQDALERAGVVSLALMPTQLRRVLAVKPLAGPADFRHMRIRISDNAASAADLRALGARPVEGVATAGVVRGLARHSLDGVESSPGIAINNGYWHDARHITGYALFDRVDTLVTSRLAWTRLSADQRDAVAAAVADTVRFSATLPQRDAASLEQLCHAGVRVTSPSRAQLAALAAATAPARAALRSAPATGLVMRELEATEGAGPRLLPVPHACAPSADAQPDAATRGGSIPEGTYVTSTTRKDYQSRGEYSADWSAAVYHWTTRLRDGRWVRLVDPKFPGQIGDVDGAGTYASDGDRVTFRYSYPDTGALSETYRWSFYQGRLTLHVIDVVDRGARIINTAHPWRRLG